MVNKCQISKSCNVKIRGKLESKIRHLCEKFPHTEWSGVLYYTFTGDWNNLEIECKDLLLMDVGTSTFTEFEPDSEAVGYMCDNNLLNCNMGLIHSHNSFGVFFSGTDVDTLEKEGKKTPHFLSVIVNNAGDCVAAVTRKIIESLIEGTETITFNTFCAETKKETKDIRITNNKEVVEYTEAVVTKEAPINLNFEYLDKRIDEVQCKKTILATNAHPQFEYPTLPGLLTNPCYDYNYNAFYNINDYSEKDFKEYAAQLASLNLTATVGTYNYLLKNVGRIDQIFERKFKGNISKYINCALCILDYILSELNVREELEVISIIQDLLMAIPKSKYISELIKELEQWK